MKQIINTLVLAVLSLACANTATAKQEIVKRIDPVVPEGYHAIIYEDVFVIGSRRIPSANPAADAYKLIDSRLKEGETVVLAVADPAGRVGIGSGWSPQDAFVLKDKDREGVNVAFVGVTPEATVGPLFLGETFHRVERAEFHNIGIKGAQDSFAIRQKGKVHNLIFNNFWVQKPQGYPQNTYQSLFHLHKDWDLLILKGYQARKHRVQHHCFYLKHGGAFQVLDCELWGGNRSGFQARPHASEPYPSPAPHGDILVEGNFAHGFGWNHVNPDGGGWITIWSSLDNKVVVRNNTCTDARYGCFVISQGLPDSEPYVTEEGYAHELVWFENNIFENKRSQRACVSFTATKLLLMGPGNHFTSNNNAMEIDTWWSSNFTDAKPVARWFIYGRESIPSFPIHYWDRKEAKYKTYTRQQVLGRVISR